MSEGRNWRTREIPDYVKPHIREAMIRERLSLLGLAERCDLTHTKVVNFMKGQNSNQQKYRSVAIAMGISCERLRNLMNAKMLGQELTNLTIEKGSVSTFASRCFVSEVFISNLRKGKYDETIFDDSLLISKALKMALDDLLDDTGLKQVS